MSRLQQQLEYCDYVYQQQIRDFHKRFHGTRSHFQIVVYGKNRVLGVRRSHGKLLTQNWAIWNAGTINGAALTLKDILGGSDVTNGQANMSEGRVYLGTGSTAEAATDYVLATATESATATVGATTVVGTQVAFPVVGSVIPAVNRSYTEAGWTFGTAAADNTRYMAQREVFSAVTCNAGQTATATFTITYN